MIPSNQAKDYGYIDPRTFNHIASILRNQALYIRNFIDAFLKEDETLQ